MLDRMEGSKLNFEKKSCACAEMEGPKSACDEMGVRKMLVKKTFEFLKMVHTFFYYFFTLIPNLKSVLKLEMIYILGVVVLDPYRQIHGKNMIFL